MMTANYHTHTPRCHHAVGDEREYIENAIKAGIKLLGFSDHTPQLYENGYISPIRMTPEEAPGYVDRLRTLADEYRGDIEIHIGFEAEYFPGIFDRLRGLCRDLGAEYLILGQHCLSDESEGAVWSTSPAGEGELKKYVDVVTEGLSTGCFTYLAHPDVLRYTGGDEKFYHDEMTRLCRAAKELSVPLEINMLGLGDHRFYPSDRFFDIAAEVGNDVIIGCDAHDPAALLDEETYSRAVGMSKARGLNLLERAELRRI